MNLDRFWLGFLTGVLLVALLTEIILWCERHLVFIK